MFYRRLVRPCLFRGDPEEAHERALALAGKFGRSRIGRDALETLFVVEDGRLRQTVFGIEFPNPVGLAAGFDKNAVGVKLWPSLGFGFVEIGSVTARPQEGNPPPRLFRLPGEQSLINRMGFNNDGADAIASRVPLVPHRVPVGINVGKSCDMELAGAADDYALTLAAFRGREDFFVINVSSPNTPGLRKLQDKSFLDDLLAVVGRVTSRGAGPTPAEVSGPTTPVLVKVAPDLTFDQLDDVLELARKHGTAGIVATNTTVNHPTPPEGGLSGVPLRGRATEFVRHIRRQTRGQLPVIGVGGIFNAADAYEKIRAGASLVEVWTGMIYEGPSIAAEINRGLLRLLERDGFGSITQAVGTG
jgi:dihydroorotate dehydrogenase